jgi:deoxyhypusine monooxygenase
MLMQVLVNEEEHRMVRHEAAEALGAIGTEECEEILKIYLKDSQQVVRESCEVALDIIDYWGNPVK